MKGPLQWFRKRNVIEQKSADGLNLALATIDTLPGKTFCLKGPRMHVRKQPDNDVVRKVLHYASTIDLDQSPPVVCQQILERVSQLTGVPDPYRYQKQKSNQTVMRMYDILKKKVQLSTDPFGQAVRLAIAGNVIDFGIYSTLSGKDIESAIHQSLATEMADEKIQGFRAAIEEATDILYLADNAGEIVLDRLFIETMKHPRVTLVVRGGAILNDATWSDAEGVGLTRLVTVMDNGSNAPGTVLGHCSPQFNNAFQQADLVIAKGQGNYESLHDCDKDIVFLLKAKCAIVAKSLNSKLGEMVLHRNRSTTPSTMV